MLAAEQLAQWEIIDYASDAKADVPNGTARELADSLATVHLPETTVATTELVGPAEARGAADLALMDRSLRSDTRNPQYGREFADRYLARCGHDAVDDDKLYFCRLLDEFF